MTSTKSPFAGVFQERKGLLVERDVSDAGITVIVEVAEIEAHARDEGAFLGQRRIGLKSDLFELVAEVVEEKVVFGVVGDEEVRLAIEIVVGNANAHALSDVVADAPFLGHILERAIPLVEEQLVGRAFVEARVAVFRNALDHAEGLVGVVPLHVIDNKEIEQGHRC